MTNPSQYYDPKTYRPREGMGALLQRARMQMLDDLERELEPLDITAAQFVILVSLAEITPYPPRGCAAACRTTPAR